MTTPAEFITKCRRKLVDTSMRNRLLNYRPGARATAVEIVGEHPGALWTILVKNRRAMTFRASSVPTAKGVAEPPEPAPEAGATQAPAATPTSAPPIPEGTKGEAKAEAPDAFAEAIGETADARHLDTQLESSLDAETLALKLRRLSDTARLSQEEQGVDTLFLALGLLGFFEDEHSEVLRRAPLLLVPVRLERDGVERWKVRMREDDPLVNPALVEYLREQHGLALPPVPENLDEFDVLAWFRGVKERIAGRPKWDVRADCFVAILSFQKFVMHEDLKRNTEVLARHEVIGQLATHTGGGGGGTAQLPAEIAALVLDEACPPEKTVHVMDADSTQARALAAVRAGHDLVVEGPPGSGKSQTIANLIAGALAEGKTVLFVAEKQAALNVVYDRLRKAGLGDACFELHSAKANKAAVLKELGRAIDATLAAAAASEDGGQELAAVRAELTAYVEAVHRKVEPLGRSVYAAVGRLTALQTAPETRAALRVEDVAGADLRRTSETLGLLAKAAARLGDPATHPWRGMEKDSLDADAREAAADACARLTDGFRELPALLAEGGAKLGVPPDLTLLASSELDSLADLVESSPGVEAAIAGDPAWAEVPADAAELLVSGRALITTEATARERLGEAPLGADLVEAAGVVRSKGHGWFRFLSGRWRAARRLLRARVVAGRWTGALDASQLVLAAHEAVAERARLTTDPVGPARFGRHWRGPDSDWDRLQAVAEWTVRFRAAVARFRLLPAAVAAVAQPGPTTGPLRRLAALGQASLAGWRSLGVAVGWPGGYFEEQPLPEVARRVAAIVRDPAGWREWTEFEQLGDQLEAGPAGPLLPEAEAGRLAWADLPAAFERRFLERWVARQVDTSEPLRQFRGASHEEKVALFRERDRKIVEHHRASLAARLRTQAQTRLRDPALQAEVRFLRDQLARQRGHKPVRQLLLNACGAVRAVKPCFLMSPMTVSLCLDPEKHRFDIVVFDEASQMTPEDALASVSRAQQMVVVGDPKQLPPTSFFAVLSGQLEEEVSADGTPGFADLDSILELALASGFPGARLRWHYRSRHESLIAYSNRSFYDSSLYTFPSADLDRSQLGLQFQHVAKGCYEGQGVNRAEAQAVVDAVLLHVREQPTRSLCVGTFSLPQQLAVQDEIERRRRDDPELEAFLSLDRPEPFFVKNLESIQGDERDVVILSITYGPGADGKVRYNFGPINGQNGWRRLNVLTTRARERMLVVSSMHAEDIDLGRAATGGAALLRTFLHYAETGVLDGGPVVDAAAQAESPFEAEVAAALTRAGVRVQPQVGVAGYRLDIGVIDPEIEGRFVCGIECDGVSYHAAESARDRDRLRESVLRGLGWRLHRVWSVDWWHDPAGQTKRLLDLIDRSREEARREGTVRPPGANAEVASTAAAAPADPVRPATEPAAPAARVVFARYVKATPRKQRSDLLDPNAEAAIVDVVLEVLREEGPVHEDELQARILTAFGVSRAGKRITERLEPLLRRLHGSQGVQTEKQFWRLDGNPVRARSRKGLSIPPERISGPEYEAAVVQALATTGPLQEPELVAVLRDGFGYGTATAALKDGVRGAVERLSSQGRLGIASSGVALVAN